MGQQKTHYFWYTMWRLKYPNTEPDKAKQSSEQRARYGFLVLQSLRQTHVLQHTEVQLLAIA